ncbi:pantoate--beta-alanine ligase [Bacillus timonensis]|nr:pantoate--beta-alanine ligase [Bacillus timonensis]
MNIVQSVEEMQQIMQDLRGKGKSIGFVPTMGFLHEGHLQLLRNCKAENEISVLSIFVNPLQFGPNEDFDSYPRDIERDEALARNAGVDILFYPSKDEMYKNNMSTRITVVDRVDVLCGEKRKGHFDGVATVLIKLFNIVTPHKAYFGMKDAQQVAVVDGLIKDFNIPVELVPVETIREEDGLAKSSRNVYLSNLERKEAPHLYQSLMCGKQAIEDGERSVGIIKQAVSKHILEHTSGKIDYVEVLSYPELEQINEIQEKVIIALAVKFTKARLIDNITLVVPNN